jgi:hypothetical protein
MSEAMRLYRENIALKAQLDGLQWHFDRMKPRATRAPVRVRAAQVFANLLTRGNEAFHLWFARTSSARWAETPSGLVQVGRRRGPGVIERARAARWFGLPYPLVAQWCQRNVGMAGRLLAAGRELRGGAPLVAVVQTTEPRQADDLGRPGGPSLQLCWSCSLPAMETLRPRSGLGQHHGDQGA